MFQRALHATEGAAIGHDEGRITVWRGMQAQGCCEQTGALGVERTGRHGGIAAHLGSVRIVWLRYCMRERSMVASGGRGKPPRSVGCLREANELRSDNFGEFGAWTRAQSLESVARRGDRPMQTQVWRDVALQRPVLASDTIDKAIPPPTVGLELFPSVWR